MKLTLDWNCVIEVEEHRPQARYVKELVDAHRRGEFEVALLAASASENSKSKRLPGNASIFKERVSSLGWQDLPLVKMPGVFGLSYWDFCYFVKNPEEFEHQMDALWGVIARRVPRDPSAFLPLGTKLTDGAIQSEALSKWRNTWCDVISAYSHIHDSRDIFVTNNTKDFQNNQDELYKLGMKHIATPADTLALVAEILSAE